MVLLPGAKSRHGRCELPLNGFHITRREPEKGDTVRVWDTEKRGKKSKKKGPPLSIDSKAAMCPGVQ